MKSIFITVIHKRKFNMSAKNHSSRVVPNFALGRLSLLGWMVGSVGSNNVVDSCAIYFVEFSTRRTFERFK